jgi:hypothetical protein
MDITLENVAHDFPTGTTVSVYPALMHSPGRAPMGVASAVTSAVVAADGSLALTGLEFAAEYVLYASVSGSHRYRRVRTPTPTAIEAAGVSFAPAGTIGATNVQAAIEEVAIEGGGAGGSIDGFYNVKDAPYSAVGDGTTDDTAAVQAAITAAKASGGIVFIPPGTYKITTTLNCNNSGKSFRVTGGGGRGHIYEGHPTLSWAGPDTDSLLTAHSCHGFELDHLRFRYTSPTYSGDLINIDGGVVGNGDSVDWYIHNCSSRGDAGGSLQYLSARSILRVNRAHTGTIEYCSWAGAENCIRLGDPGGDYVNVIEIRRCEFHYSSDAHILIGSADLEACVIDGCTFEAGTVTPGIRGASTAIDGAQCGIYSLEIAHSWFGDASGAVKWISGLRGKFGFSPIAIRNNTMFDTADVHISGVQGMFIVEDNYFSSGSAVFDLTSSCNLYAKKNGFNTPTAIFSGTRPRTITMLDNITGGAGATMIEQSQNLMPSRLALGNGGSINPGYSASSFAGTQTELTAESLVLGAVDATVRQALGPKAGIYTIRSGNSTATLIIQPPTDSATGREVQLCGGVTPTPVVRVGAAKLAFFDTAPIVKPAVTGSRGGNAALASLLTQLAALGLITDSSSA